MSEELLPCPFCGKKPRIYQDEYPYGPGGPIPLGFVVECCVVKINESTEKRAIKHWNTRKEKSCNSKTKKPGTRV